MTIRSRILPLVAKAAVTTAVASAAIVGVSAGTADAASYYSNYWGAIAISPATGNTAYSYDYATSASAQNSAVSRCGARDCQAVVTVANGCAAAAQASNRAWGWGYAASRAQAENIALAHTRGSGARIIQWVCTTGHR